MNNDFDLAMFLVRAREEYQKTNAWTRLYLKNPKKRLYYLGALLEWMANGGGGKDMSDLLFKQLLYETREDYMKQVQTERHRTTNISDCFYDMIDLCIDSGATQEEAARSVVDSLESPGDDKVNRLLAAYKKHESKKS